MTMGTKNMPGTFDCYAAADPDEPMFVLLGRDPVASVVVRFWRELREAIGDTEKDKLEEATQCANAMRGWAVARGKAKADKVTEAEEVYMKWFDGIGRLAK
jgi:hypothetical protein